MTTFYMHTAMIDGWEVYIGEGVRERRWTRTGCSCTDEDDRITQNKI